MESEVESSKAGKGGEAGVVISESWTGMETGMELAAWITPRGRRQDQDRRVVPFKLEAPAQFHTVDRHSEEA